MANEWPGDYYKSLKKVITTHEEVVKAFENAMGDVRYQMKDQKDFIAFVEQLRQSVAQELSKSAQDVEVASQEAMARVVGLSEVSSSRVYPSVFHLRFVGHSREPQRGIPTPSFGR